MLSTDLTAFWGNPVIPSVTVATIAGVVVSLVTPENKVSPEQAQAILDAERAQMELGSAPQETSAKPTPVTE
jgi:SSS family solute:Na+ symporter